MMKRNIAVIVTYNRLQLLKECIDAVLQQTYPFTEIIVVNNCSMDGTTEYLEQKSEEINSDRNLQTVLTVLHEKENLGGAGGFYEALKEASGREADYILIIDDDAMLHPDYMEQLMQYQEQHLKEKYEALAGIVETDGKVDITHRRRLGNKYIFNEPPVPLEEYQQEAFPCQLATFCGLVVRGDVLKRVGLPKKEYFIWYDDSEFCLRLKGIQVVTGAVLNHKTKLPEAEKGLLERPTWRHYYGYRNRYDTSRIHFGWLPSKVIALEYHVLRLLSVTLLFSKEKRQQGRFNIRMIRQALHDGKHKKLGKNMDYGPWVK